jgi:hypothetical protein
MPVYTVHAPVEPKLSSFAATDRFVFIRDGFHFWAMAFGPLWLLVRRLWLGLLGYVVIVGVLEVVLWLLQAGPAAQAAMMILIALLMGLEAASIRRWSYSRRKWRQVGLVVADDIESAERRFFESTHRDRAVTAHDSLSGFPPSSPSGSAARESSVLGLFPEPGGAR